MGRIKTTLVKRTGATLFEAHPDSFSEDFNGNKAAVSSYAEVRSKKMRNLIAGYVTRVAKNKNKED